MKQTNFKWFTLVELIVVITIIAILWTIAFITLQWYSAQARDSKRLSDIQNIKKSLELFSLNTWKYPLPDEYGVND
jgi:prepilin-type N-terminal cleavage/methylation domain-containing protein